MPVRLSLRVINTTIPIVLGYHFLARTQPTIDWKQRVLMVERKRKVFEITQGLVPNGVSGGEGG